MPPVVALSLCVIGILVLLWRESKVRPEVSAATWIPTLWLVLIASRSVSLWMSLGSPLSTTADALMDGSPVDRAVFLSLMITSVLVLWYRRFRLGRLILENKAWVLFFVYCGLSVAWSDYPGVTFRRWFKSAGDPLMVLVLLTEARPAMAVEVVLRRCAYVLLPISILFVKYYPELGRAYSPWGDQFFTGVTTNKNLLGYVLFVLGLFFVTWLFTKQAPADPADKAVRRVRRDDMLVTLVFMLFIAYLFKMADSQTPVVALAAATGIVIALRFEIVQRHFGKFATVGLVCGVLLQFTLNINKAVIEGVGRDTTLTGRTEIWDKALGLVSNPVLGAGFETFWLGDRLLAMWQAFPVFLPNQAHNGYIEMYLNLGAVGFVLFVLALASSYRSIHGKLLDAGKAATIDIHEMRLGVLGVAYFCAYLLYNVTEATFKPLTILFVVFLAVTIRYTPVEAVAAVAVRSRKSTSGGLSGDDPRRKVAGGWNPMPPPPVPARTSPRVSTWRGKPTPQSSGAQRPGRQSVSQEKRRIGGEVGGRSRRYVLDQD